MLYESKTNRKDYYPPILGNGDIAFSVDAEGCLGYNAADFGAEGTKTALSGGWIIRAGRRINRAFDTEAKLLPFGRLFFEKKQKPLFFSQELDVRKAQVRSRCEYPDGLKTQTVGIIHPSRNIYALKKTVSTDTCIKFRYELNGYDRFVENAIRHVDVTAAKNGIKVDYFMVGSEEIRGSLRLFFDRTAEVRCNGNEAVISSEMAAGESVCLYLCLEDSLDGDFEAILDENIKYISTVGFDGIAKDTTAEWKSYYANGYVKTGDERIDSVYETALYHLKCYTTKWSIPVGLNMSCWHAGFFAFDEYYSLLGLLGADQLDLARRVPEFRLNSCLKRAIAFQHHTFKNEPKAARFMWITEEHGAEMASHGFWMDHIFHMAVIALGAFECFEYSGDIELLKRYYPLILSCATFYVNQSVYTHPDGSVTVGKCTDLERLGPSRENPFMTSCGVIKTLECLVKAADILGVDKGFRDECEQKAAGLRKTLPNDGEKYVPFLGCEQRSIGVFSGKYPFDVLENDDRLMLNAWEDYVKNEERFGNMYSMGGGVSSWYAAWKAAANARAGFGDKAYRYLKQACLSVGAFCEMFEINEPDRVMYRPWFTTAAGVFMCAVNDMLLKSDGKNITLLPAFGGEVKDLSFKLRTKGGVTVEAAFKNGRLTELALSSETVDADSFNVFYRGERVYQNTI